MNARNRHQGRAGRGLLLLLVAAGLLAGAAQDEGSPKKTLIGKSAPAFTLADTKGKQRSLADHKGKIVILEWINPECPYVRRHYRSKSMQKAYRKVREVDKDVVWLAIDSSKGSTARGGTLWIEAHGLEYPILLDPAGTIGRDYDARRTPHMFVIDKKGVVRYHGAIDDNAVGNKRGDEVTNYVVGAVRQIVAEESVSPEYVKPYGCTVQYAH